MCQIAINIPEEVLFDAKMSHEQARQFVRQLTALGYYTKNGISIGYCSQIAGMTEEESYINFSVRWPGRISGGIRACVK